MENVNQQPEQELTAEQLSEQKENMLKFYTESLPYLNAQLAYEELLVKIDEARFKRSNIAYQFAMMMTPPQDEATGSDHDVDTTSNIPEQGSRKLKRD
jgi:hypothetical protein|tara:strand:- start:504 stop:797 length:294 start_codon:yes stop_codon:yes gene_type:complete